MRSPRNPLLGVVYEVNLASRTAASNTTSVLLERVSYFLMHSLCKRISGSKEDAAQRWEQQTNKITEDLPI
jgi:hypothetical protein